MASQEQKVGWGSVWLGRQEGAVPSFSFVSKVDDLQSCGRLVSAVGPHDLEHKTAWIQAC